MAQLLKIKDIIIRFVEKYEVYVFTVIRFLIAFICFMLINRTVGFMEALVPMPVSLCLAAACAFLPFGVALFVGAILIVLNFYALSIELAFAALLLFIIMFFVYYRFTSGKGIYTMLTPLLSIIGIPYVMPISVGLLEQPQNVLSVICGSVTYYMVRNVRENEEFFRSMGSSGGHFNNMAMIWRQLSGNQEMFIAMIAFAAGAIAVYYVRRAWIRYSQTAAVLTGGIVQLLIFGGGMIMSGNYARMAGLIVGCAVSVVIGLAVSFLSLSVDYNRVEKVQFEDDEYYYYVRAIPKTSVSAGEKQIKAISLTEEEEKEDREGKTVLGILRRRQRQENMREKKAGAETSEKNRKTQTNEHTEEMNEAGSEKETSGHPPDSD